MDTMLNPLKKCILMKNFSDSEIENLLAGLPLTVDSYSRNEVIAIEGSSCSKIGIILSGIVEVQKLYASGKIITMSSLSEGNIFGEVIIFSNRNTYPATIISSTSSNIMFISKESILKLCSMHSIFLNNFMTLLSDKILMLNKKVKNMSYQTLRQKIAAYLLEEYESQKSLRVKLNITKKELAGQLGVPRPSLSRELINMKNDNLIEMIKNTIIIKDIESIYNLFY
ncbi:MAG: Crp/Fnr family transcriptional regulator [Clostridium sp.]|uniref:Crp/Fnr family transcriptional regulator n=1 Tax=Clostridium sp. TaxID=1506 RepID=UPI0025C2ACC7|nr:Crp/Fnr family transcriptional regulator [Clostridium sp.]MCH3963165.1 Crp/Fnr family transcriptional regulator [Clostridium sp.]MCI1716372.1 Crp/Fnr family transcriptional regulator [Clostridium sp.]MCI1800712.1 Crp/Fnr family transcriptional regulator [Clostridium sp.]MCI1814633.1 Crp/Fnr family transcriptional regulator [Clostridium sp.]MCI1871543.1 Crp/Fnr family transcriptional regulator [Clostridium sp.]